MNQIILALLLGATLVQAGITHAGPIPSDQTILGNLLLVKDPSTADKRKVTVKAKEKNSLDTIAGDPTVDGANAAVLTSGMNPTQQFYALPQGLDGNGKPFWSGDAAKGFKYKDSAGVNGPVKSAQIKKSGAGTFSVKILINGKLGNIDVVPPDPGDGGCAALQLVNGSVYSMMFQPGDAQVVNKGATLFKAFKPTVEGLCFPPSTTTTTSTSTSSTSSTSTSTSVTSTTSSSTTSTTLDCTAFAGPSYPPVCGNNNFSFSGNPGDVGGRTVSYFDFSPASGWTQLYWGVWAPFFPATGLDGSPHTMSFGGISGGGSVVTWDGTSPWTDPSGPTFYPSVPTRITITVTAGAVSWVDSTTIPGLDPGLGTGIGAVIDLESGGVPVPYTVLFEFTADIPTDGIGNYIPASTVPGTGGLLIFSYSGGFYSQQ